MEAAMADTSLQLLGGFGLLVGQRDVHLPFQAQRVLAYLAIGESPVMRHQIAAQLWPFTHHGPAQGNLRTALWRVRQAAPLALHGDRETVGLAGRVLVDYRQVLRPHRWAASTAARDLEALLVLRRDLLPGWDEDWLLVERERARQLRMRCLEGLSRSCVEAGNITGAIEAAYAAMEIEPLRESAHLVLIEAHIADGNRAEAARHAARTTDLIERELDIAPSPQFRERMHSLGITSERTP